MFSISFSILLTSSNNANSLFIIENPFIFLLKVSSKSFSFSIKNSFSDFLLALFLFSCKILNNCSITSLSLTKFLATFICSSVVPKKIKSIFSNILILVSVIFSSLEFTKFKKNSYKLFIENSCFAKLSL